ncbi:type II toxin-antitoxin system HipA family toxin [Chondrinema litorale]|uniref:type II toxin-antitoxin system HipA family toxin n=1 Tax=Chondrinema litorale TaxID=2994555 RepID=UPI002542E77E|nr:HipA domain-containing protein [Chondrinema litorale]UZS00313.1 HipA domain-containing protein [Chondrinema litorale]
MKEIIVYADWDEFSLPTKMGLLKAELSRGEEIFSFEYDSQWLVSGKAQILDPELQFFSGPQYLNNDKPNFGLFLDSSPDRWGRTLMERREIIRSKSLGEQRFRLMESDFLLGVNDETRMGALRFKLQESGDFLSNETLETPPFTSIRELEAASLKTESDDFFNDKDAQKWLSLLMAPGSSLGGARPKANVKDTDNHLWIAKFPSKNDDKDSGAWEFIAHQMAKNLGITVAKSDARVFSQKRHTFLTKRFDRTNQNRRIHFASAMTLLGYKDGDNYKDGISYLDIVEIIERYGSDPDNDIRELWKRIVFSVAISNTDDHLRNHGFLLNERGWKLSPAYDINPIEKGSGLSLNISEDDNSLDFDLCMNVADYFRLKKDEANSIIKETKNVVSGWKNMADKMKIPNAEQTIMESAFNGN